MFIRSACTVCIGAAFLLIVARLPYAYKVFEKIVVTFGLSTASPQYIFKLGYTSAATFVCPLFYYLYYCHLLENVQSFFVRFLTYRKDTNILRDNLCAGKFDSFIVSSGEIV